MVTTTSSADSHHRSRRRLRVVTSWVGCISVGVPWAAA